MTDQPTAPEVDHLLSLYDDLRGPGHADGPDDLDDYLFDQRQDPEFVVAYIRAHIEALHEDRDAARRVIAAALTAVEASDLVSAGAILRAALPSGDGTREP